MEVKVITDMEVIMGMEIEDMVTAMGTKVIYI